MMHTFSLGATAALAVATSAAGGVRFTWYECREEQSTSRHCVRSGAPTSWLELFGGWARNIGAFCRGMGRPLSTTPARPRPAPQVHLVDSISAEDRPRWLTARLTMRGGGVHSAPCMQAIPADKAGYQADKQVIRVAEAESIGIRVPSIEPARLKRGARIARGGEGVVYKATLSGVGEVALKCLPLAGTSEQDRAQASCSRRADACQSEHSMPVTALSTRVRSIFAYHHAGVGRLCRVCARRWAMLRCGPSYSAARKPVTKRRKRGCADAASSQDAAMHGARAYR